MLSLTFSPFPALHTERLILRRLETTDDAQIFSLRSNDLVNKYLERTKADSIEDAAQFIRKINASIEKSEVIFWGIALKDNPKLVGTELLPEFQGKGIIQEAIARVIEFGFSKMKLRAIEAYTHPENDKSSKLLERFYFRKTGVLENKNEGETGEIKMIIYTLTNNTNSD